MAPSDDTPVSLHAVPQPDAPFASTSPLDTPADPFEAWALGETVGRYRPVSVHRTGGLGQVWRADDPVVGRTVALKCLRPDRGGAGVRRRFINEAEVTGRLEHPNIVPLYDLIGGPGGPAYVMRFVVGQNLAEKARGYHTRRRAGRASPVELAELVGAVVLVCEAVAYAHTRGVLHRDLKGQNVLLGEFGQVCLADWGLAKLIGEPDRPGDLHPLSPPLEGATEDGAVLGTPSFMAPELAAGAPASVATDVYGLGAVLYQVLTDTVPHKGTTPQETLGLVKALPALPVRVVNRSVPVALSAVCDKALSRDPGDRYPDAAALAADLRAALAGEPVTARREGLAERVGRWGRRHKAWVRAAAVGLAVAAGGAGIGAGLLYQEKERTAEKAREAAAARDTADGVAAVLFDLVEAAESGTAGTPPAVEARKAAVRKALAATERLAAAGPADAGRTDQLARLLRYTGNLARLSGDWDGADAALAAAEKLLRGADRRPALARVLADRGAGLLELGRLTPAVAALDEAGQAAAADTGPGGRRTVAVAALYRSAAQLRLGRFDPAAADAAAAVAGFARLVDDPADPYFLDRTLLGAAQLQAAAVGRERVAVRGGDRAAVAAATADAVATLRLAAEADAGRDVRVNYFRGLIELAEVRRWAGQPAATARADLDRAVAGLDAIAAADPGVAFPRQWLAKALTARAAEPGGDPAADLDRAVKLLEPQAEVVGPGRARYLSDLSAVWAGIARRRTVPADAREAYQKAASTARGAAKLSPEDVIYPRRAAEVVAEAAAAGHDVSRPQPAAGG